MVILLFVTASMVLFASVLRSLRVRTPSVHLSFSLQEVKFFFRSLRKDNMAKKHSFLTSVLKVLCIIVALRTLSAELLNINVLIS